MNLNDVIAICEQLGFSVVSAQPDDFVIVAVHKEVYIEKTVNESPFAFLPKGKVLLAPFYFMVVFYGDKKDASALPEGRQAICKHIDELKKELDMRKLIDER